ncbi:UDP-2,3-diacylglucosamine hydrolase [Betaproteobacteria bacterium]|nr:UDP-2,3-diacylglucosamine hydrolase [Betaproteobacteria bacterium]
MNALKSADPADKSGPMSHFLSDLHLSPDTPGITRLFLDYLAGEARAAGQIFILGDLFDAWPGDDAIDDPGDGFSRDIVDALRRLADAGTGVAVLHGNRDFLLGERFAEQSGARLLPDPYLLSLPTGQFILSHGDALCTDDTGYQLFRAQVRTPAWRDTFLTQSLEKRRAIAAALRQQSEAYKREKNRQATDLDLNAADTDDFLRQHGYATMIHGHTHRPDRHDHLVDGIHVERWVLADWREDHGEYLAWDGQRLTRHALVPASTGAG